MQVSGIMPDETGEFMGKAEQKELFGVDQTNALYASARRNTRPSTTGARPGTNRVGEQTRTNSIHGGRKRNEMMADRGQFDELQGEFKIERGFMGMEHAINF